MAAFYLDNDVDVALATLLQAQGHTATTVRDLRLQRASDAEHLLLAAQNEWIMVTLNAGHFRVLHDA
jgi:predicted nuclease of predicted toxin-antitoxin system